MDSPISVMADNLIMEDVEERATASFGYPFLYAVDEFYTHLNLIQSSIKFIMKGKKDNCVSFMDILITRCHTGTFDTNI